MNFEEDFVEKFPSLKEHITPEVREKNVLIRAAWVNVDNIQQFCLDKSKVKQAIEKEMCSFTQGHIECDSCITLKRILKVLGLG